MMIQFLLLLLPRVSRWTSPTPSCGTEVSEAGEGVATLALALGPPPLEECSTSRMQRGRWAPDGKIQN